jgi:L-arabinose isomerase
VRWVSPHAQFPATVVIKDPFKTPADAAALSAALDVLTEAAMMTVWPASSPFTPACMLIEFVQNTARRPMYSLYSQPEQETKKKVKSREQERRLG